MTASRLFWIIGSFGNRKLKSHLRWVQARLTITRLRQLHNYRNGVHLWRFVGTNLPSKRRKPCSEANELASEHGNPELLPLHLLAALLEDKEGIVPPVLEKIGIGPQAVLSEIYREIEKLPKVSGTEPRKQHSRRQPTRCWSRLSKKRRISRTSTFRPSTCCWR